jgi:DNA (cytosine-5)-methyltransferase 1
MRIISLFSGAGGLDLGFTMAGHKVVWANDNWSEAAETYKKNIGNHITTKNIEEISTAEIPDADMIVGGFPCQGFSHANTKRHLRDKRNSLYLHFLRILEAKKTPFFLAENVKGIMSLGGGKVFEMILNGFSDVGYNVRHAVLNAANYGIPQRRERVLIFGVRKDLDYSIDFPPQPTHSCAQLITDKRFKKWVSIGEALKGIPEPNGKHTLANHECSKYKLTFNGYIGHRKIDPSMPSPTITARGDDFGGVVIHHHPKNHRRMTVREAAIIQSFPKTYVFVGAKTSGYRQVANAVPPLLAKAIAEKLPMKLVAKNLTNKSKVIQSFLSNQSKRILAEKM